MRRLALAQAVCLCFTVLLLRCILPASGTSVMSSTPPDWLTLLACGGLSAALLFALSFLWIPVSSAYAYEPSMTVDKRSHPVPQSVLPEHVLAFGALAGCCLAAWLHATSSPEAALVAFLGLLPYAALVTALRGYVGRLQKEDLRFETTSAAFAAYVLAMGGACALALDRLTPWRAGTIVAVIVCAPVFTFGTRWVNERLAARAYLRTEQERWVQQGRRRLGATVRDVDADSNGDISA